MIRRPLSLAPMLLAIAGLAACEPADSPEASDAPAADEVPVRQPDTEPAAVDSAEMRIDTAADSIASI